MSKNNKLDPRITSQIQEHSSGGFLLLRIDGNGNIISDSSFDNEASYLAIVSKAKMIVDGMNELNAEYVIGQLTGEIVDEEDLLIEEEMYEDDEGEDWKNGS